MIPCRAFIGAPLLAILLAPLPARAQTSPEALPECLPRPTLPLPTCVPAQSVEEHALVTLVRARAWLRNEQFAEAAQHLAKSLSSLDGSRDIGLLVRVHAAYGDALLGLARQSEAESELRAASGLWARGATLAWLRSLPKDETTRRSLQAASDAAASAVLHLAESHLQDAKMAPPPFTPGSSPRRAAFLRYWADQVPPWFERKRDALVVAERELEQVYLVAPVLAAEWRVAVAADVGSLWGLFVEQQRAVANACGDACDDGHSASYYGTFDDSWAPDQHRARDAFETGVALSRRYRLFTASTRACEQWLARTYRHEYAGADELVPTAHWIDNQHNFAPFRVP